MAARIPPDVVAVAESGIRDGDDARRLAEAGYDAILVGETLVRAGDRAAELRRADRAPGRRRDERRPLRQDLRDHVRGGRAALGQPRRLGGRLHLRPFAPAGLGAAGRRHRQAAAPSTS